MSYDLPQATKTRKFQSLNEDQRKIAEELIAKKFDVKEEVVAKRDASFRQEYPGDIRFASTPNGPNGFFNESFMDFGREDYESRNGVRTRLDIQTRRRVSSITVGEPSTRAVRDGLMRFDMENLPRHDRKLYASPNWLRQLSYDEGFRHYVEVREDDRGYMENVIGRIFGVPIIAKEGVQAHLQVMY